MYKMSGNPVKNQMKNHMGMIFFMYLTYWGRISGHNGSSLCPLIDKAI